MLLTPTGGAFDDARNVRWKEAATLPLCLLTRDMQNRRIIDRLFPEGGAPLPNVAVETRFGSRADRTGSFRRLVKRRPAHLSHLARAQERSALTGLRAIPHWSGRGEAQPSALCIADRDPLPPLTRALLKIDRSLGHPSPSCAGCSPTQSG